MKMKSILNVQKKVNSNLRMSFIRLTIKKFKFKGAIKKSRKGQSLKSKEPENYNKKGLYI
jgi:hypothetical protein